MGAPRVWPWVANRHGYVGSPHFVPEQAPHTQDQAGDHGEDYRHQQVDEEAPEYYQMYAAMRIWSGDESTTAYQLTIGFDRNVYAHRQGIEDYKRVKDVASDLLEFWGPLSKAIRDNNPDSRRLGDPHFVRVYSPVLFEKRPGLDRPGEVSIYFSVPHGSLDDPANRERLVVEMVKQVRASEELDRLTWMIDDTLAVKHEQEQASRLG